MLTQLKPLVKIKNYLLNNLYLSIIIKYFIREVLIILFYLFNFNYDNDILQIKL